MRFTTILLLAIALLGSFASMQAADRIGVGEVAYGFTSAPNTLHPENPGWCDDNLKTCVCFIYFPIVSGIEEKDLFNGAPSAANARFTWVSEFPAQQTMLPSGPFTLYIVPAGPATIYYNAMPPAVRDPRVPATLGEPVAKFDRKAGLYISLAPTSGTAPPGWVDPFVSSADLVWSKTFPLNGKPFNFRDLIPHGITCHEVASTSAGTEAGSCVVTGN